MLRGCGSGKGERNRERSSDRGVAQALSQARTRKEMSRGTSPRRRPRAAVAAGRWQCGEVNPHKRKKRCGVGNRWGGFWSRRTGRLRSSKKYLDSKFSVGKGPPMGHIRDLPEIQARCAFGRNEEDVFSRRIRDKLKSEGGKTARRAAKGRRPKAERDLHCHRSRTAKGKAIGRLDRAQTLKVETKKGADPPHHCQRGSPQSAIKEGCSSTRARQDSTSGKVGSPAGPVGCSTGSFGYKLSSLFWWGGGRCAEDCRAGRVQVGSSSADRRSGRGGEREVLASGGGSTEVPPRPGAFGEDKTPGRVSRDPQGDWVRGGTTMVSLGERGPERGALGWRRSSGARLRPLFQGRLKTAGWGGSAGRNPALGRP